MPESEKPLDPYYAMCVLYHDDKEIGRIPACAVKTPLYIDELVRHYKNVRIEYEYCEHAQLLAQMHGGVRMLPRMNLQ